VSTQLCPHVVNGVEQAATHAPDWQNDAEDGHTLPHAPQLFGSAPSSAHVPAQSVVPVAQLHAPFAHDSLVGHAVPHAPQFAAFVSRSTQALLQDASPTAHVV
jgi:hypothetical protein